MKVFLLDHPDHGPHLVLGDDAIRASESLASSLKCSAREISVSWRGVLDHDKPVPIAAMLRVQSP